MPSLARIYASAAGENKRAIEETMLSRAGGTLLDVGCADGSNSIRLAGWVGAAQVIGLELADQFIASARERGVDGHQVDITERWPLADASVDGVHSNQVIEPLAQTDHLMREIRRVLKADGYPVVPTKNLASWHNIASLMLGWQPLPCHVSDESVVGNPMALAEERYGPDIHRHLRIFTGRALGALAESHGLHLDDAVGSGCYPLGASAARVMARLDRRHSVYLVQRYVPVA